MPTRSPSCLSLFSLAEPLLVSIAVACSGSLVSVFFLLSLFNIRPFRSQPRSPLSLLLVLGRSTFRVRLSVFPLLIPSSIIFLRRGRGLTFGTSSRSPTILDACRFRAIVILAILRLAPGTNNGSTEVGEGLALSVRPVLKWKFFRVLHG